ncbi:hypothetical protein NCC49_004079 [Naganishia albida]|nr:hypothetical protein NCC49_004079 [Naganishia albida]
MPRINDRTARLAVLEEAQIKMSGFVARQILMDEAMSTVEEGTAWNDEEEEMLPEERSFAICPQRGNCDTGRSGEASGQDREE